MKNNMERNMDEQTREKLGFEITDGETRCIKWDGIGQQPASAEVIALWDALAALSQRAEAEGDSSHSAVGECGSVPAPSVWGIDYMGESTSDFYLDRANAEAAIAYRNTAYPHGSMHRSVAAYVKVTK